MQCLNLGCGQRFHPDWVNVDFVSTDAGVIAANLAKGIPFPDGHFDVVYHSHALEHFSKPDALDFIGECYRVLRSDGVIRVVVPNLEGIVSQYLAWLEKARSGVKGAAENYEWIMLELYDQVVRNKSGGAMAQYLLTGEVTNEDFIVQRCGLELKRLIDEGKRRNEKLPLPAAKPSVLDPLKCFGKFFLSRNFRKEFLLRGLLKDEYEALQIGRFRTRGENHQWMYDSYSLGRLLSSAGFASIVEQSAFDRAGSK